MKGILQTNCLGVRSCSSEESVYGESVMRVALFPLVSALSLLSYRPDALRAMLSSMKNYFTRHQFRSLRMLTALAML